MRTICFDANQRPPITRTSAPMQMLSKLLDRRFIQGGDRNASSICPNHEVFCGPNVSASSHFGIARVVQFVSKTLKPRSNTAVEVFLNRYREGFGKSCGHDVLLCKW